MRGTHQHRRPQSAVHRFIPAHAGNTRAGHAGSCAHAVHPRACGELAALWFQRALNIGSSPRMRGTRGQHLVLPGGGRFIPAHAGNTAPSVD
ncbi:protein of unknown function [Denitratisoma oestradiolicum]|uniref:Uncharacterized protein n=1 Tax=Denitratisoma oestradiolicum TaxID=311182 RepID=A0A6S6XVL1_9PROT|nr:protein of unknown function [Denitratisoma oestradiolicum]